VLHGNQVDKACGQSGQTVERDIVPVNVHSMGHQIIQLVKPAADRRILPDSQRA
jgi:hypothetical protein